jgi:hypothetical protein
MTDTERYERKVNHANWKLELADAIAEHREQSELDELRAMRFQMPWHAHKTATPLTRLRRRHRGLIQSAAIIAITLAALAIASYIDHHGWIDTYQDDPKLLQRQ